MYYHRAYLKILRTVYENVNIIETFVTIELGKRGPLYNLHSLEYNRVQNITNTVL